jgi:hypothetical protein
MKKVAVLLGFCLVFSSVFLASGKSSDYEKYWPQWRGPFMTGVSPNGDPPLEWSETIFPETAMLLQSFGEIKYLY